MLEHDQNTDVALSLAQTARRGMPNDPGVADTLGWAYYRKGSYQLAVDLLEEAAKKAPQNPNIHYHLGLAYQQVHNVPAAKSELDSALKLSPSGPHAGEIHDALAKLNVQ
jgi:Flp pilus assembly protein TadD